MIKNTLLPHQEKAVEKLKGIKVGALFMEQGTGKTITAATLCDMRISKGKVDRILWLCPCSVKENLKVELEKQCTDDFLEKVIICGIETLSSSIRANIRLLELVTTYRVFLVVDESLLIKNFQAIRSRNIQRLADKCQYKLILNGTPVSKNEADLFGQFYILDWRILGYKSYYSFAHNHVVYDDDIKTKEVGMKNTDYLAKKIEPYTFQVLKKDCVKLPNKTYTYRYFELTDEQNRMYDYAFEELMEKVSEFKPETVYRLFTALQDITSGFKVVVNGNHIESSDMFAIPYDNPRVRKLLSTVYDDRKQIIFCKYTKEIDDICNVLSDRYGNDNVCRMDGTLSLKRRDVEIQKFKDYGMFLVANRTCAGFGLNLQFCSTVIYYNNDWDLATRLQSEDRVHRIGQTEQVEIIDMCAENTIDETIAKCLGRKENLLYYFKSEIDKNYIINCARPVKILKDWSETDA